MADTIIIIIIITHTHRHHVRVFRPLRQSEQYLIVWSVVTAFWVWYYDGTFSVFNWYATHATLGTSLAITYGALNYILICG